MEKISVETTKKSTKNLESEEDLVKLFSEAKNIKPKFHLTAEEMDEVIEEMFQ